MFNYAKEMYKQGYNLQEYKEMLKYLKEVAIHITGELKKYYNNGIYRDKNVLYSFFPELEEIHIRQLLMELKNLGVEFYDNGKLWRY